MMEKFGFREICREAVLGYLFWSIFQALAPMIWFYPLNAMEVSGFEVFLLSLFSPILLGPAFIRSLVQTRLGLGAFRLICVASLASFQTPDTLTRLVVLSFGNFFAMLVLTASFWSPSSHQRSLTFWGLVLGLFAFLVSRIWYTTYVPTWNDDLSNSVVISICFIAAIDKFIAGDDELSDTPKKVGSPTSPTPWVRYSVGFGSLFYLTHWLFGEVSVLSRWVGKAYPDTGPPSYPFGFCVLVALFVGVVLSSMVHKYSRVAWWLIGLAGMLALNYLDRWPAFCGGLVVAVFTMSLWPVMVEQLTICPPGRSMGLVVLTWAVLILHEIWTVAYNFVPGGVYTREHTDHLIVMVFGGLALGYLSGKSKESRFTESRSFKGNSLKAILVMLLLGAGGFASRYHKQHFSRQQKNHPRADFTAGVWAFHFGYDNEGWPSMEKSSDFINNTGVDFIGLLETDASKPFLGSNDLCQWLSERLGMYSDFGPSTRQHCWGVAFLSKYPIIKSSHHLLPSPHGELAPAIMATVNMTGHLVDFLVTHMGNDWDVLDRELQAKALSKLLSTTKNPVVFLGYVTSKPGSRDYNRLLTGGNVKDIDDTDKKRFCQYIMYRGLIRLGYARVSHGGLSDTEVQMARFRVPENLKQFEDNNKVTIDPKEVTEEFRFNAGFGKHKQGHHYPSFHHFHMNTPKYFLP